MQTVRHAKQMTALALGLAWLVGQPLFAQTVGGVINLDQGNIDNPVVERALNVQETSIQSAAGVGQLLIAVSFVEGDPQVSFTDPTGQRLFLDSDGVHYQRFPWGLMAFIEAPKPGRWLVRLENSLGPNSYQVKAMGIGGKPAVQVLSPGFAGEPADHSASVRGVVQGAIPGQAVSVILSSKSDSATGPTAAEATVAADGSVNATLSLDDFADGEYFVAFSLDMGDLPSVTAFAPGSLRVRHLGPLIPVSGLAVAGDATGTLLLSWTNPMGPRVDGFVVHVQPVGGVEEVIKLGYLTRTSLSGFAPSTQADVWITSVTSDNQTVDGAKIRVSFQPPTQATNVPSLAQTNYAISTVVGGAATLVTLPVLGSFTTTQSALDYVEAQVFSPADGLFVRVGQTRYNVASGERTVEVRFSAAETTAPGTYSVPIDIVNLGDRRQKASAVITVHVTYPSATITKVTPSTWLSGPTPALTIEGSGFLAGTRVFLDQAEQPIASMNRWNLNLSESPIVLTSGAHELRVQGPSGDQQVQTVYVNDPWYLILAYKTKTQALAGGTTNFWLSIQALNGFDKTAGFAVLTKPNGWAVSFDRDAIRTGEILKGTVVVPSSATPGTYQIVLGDGAGTTVNCSVEVLNHQPAPTIASLSSSSELPGTALRLWGYAFGTNPGVLKLGDRIISPTLWLDEELQFTIPSDAQSGGVSLTTADGRLSNTVYFYVKNYGFKLYTPRDTYPQQPGDLVAIDLSLTGFSAPVALSVRSPSPYIVAHVRNVSVTPVGGTVLDVAVDKSAPNGSYELSIGGGSGVFQASKAVIIRVGDAFEITDPSLPSGREGTNYAFTFATTNGTAPVNFVVGDGRLPNGLSLSSGGVLKGQPTESGVYRFVLTATDSVGRTRQKSLSITVDEFAWLSPGGDGGHSAYAPVDSPADARKLWTKEPEGQVRGLLAGAGRVFVWTANSLVAYEPLSGTVLYRIRQTYSQVLYHQGYLLALETSGLLHAFETSLGLEVWNRPDVTGLTLRNGNILAATALGLLELVPPTGQLIASYSGNFTGDVLAFQGQPIRIQDGGLQSWSPVSGWSALWRDSLAAVVRVACDGQGLLINLADGRVVLTDLSGQILNSWNQAGVTALILGTDYVAYAGPLGGAVRARIDGQLLTNLPALSYLHLIGAKEKLFALTSTALLAINKYRGSSIWQEAGGFADLLLRGDRLYVVSQDGRLSTFNAPDNVAAPVSTLALSPASPSGSDGWYRANPTASIQATDNETFPQTVYWAIGTADYTTYAGPQVLANGVNQLRFYAVDSKGLRETEHLVNLKIDAVPPVTSWTISADQSHAPYFQTPVTVAFTATDAGGSGLDRTEFRLDSGTWTTYTGQSFRFDREGFHSLSVRSFDKAGGVEAEQTREFRIDLSPPVAGIETDEDPGRTIVYLFGTDTISAITQIVYRLDGGAVGSYQTPLVLQNGGNHTLEVRVTDASGRVSDWLKQTIQVRKDDDRNLVSKIAYFDKRDARDVVEDARVGMEVFRGSADRYKTLPAEVLGALYFKDLDSDGRYAGTSLLQFRADESLVVWFLRDAESKASVAGYDKVRDYAAGVLSTTFFKKGAALYKRAVAKGTTVTIGGAALGRTGGDGVFVANPSWNGLLLTGPRPGQTLYAGLTYQMTYTGATLTDLNYRYRVDEGEWAEVKLVNGSWTIPWVADQTQLELRLTGKSAGKVLEAIGLWSVANKEAVTITNPYQDRVFAVGTPVAVSAEQARSDGSVVPGAGIRLVARQGNQSIAIAGPTISFDKPGLWEILATADSAHTTVLTDRKTILIVPKGGWVKFPLPDDRGRRWAEKIARGFDGPDCDDDQVNVRDQQNKMKPINAIVWKTGSTYQVRVEPGWYEVRVIIAPVQKNGVHGLVVQGLAFNAQTKDADRLMAVRYQVNVANGLLSLKATAGTKMIRLEYKPIDVQSAPTAKDDGPAYPEE